MALSPYLLDLHVEPRTSSALIRLPRIIARFRQTAIGAVIECRG